MIYDPWERTMTISNQVLSEHVVVLHNTYSAGVQLTLPGNHFILIMKTE